MNNRTTLAVAVLAVAGLMVVQEVRFARQLKQLRAEAAGRADDSAPPAAPAGEDMPEMIRQVSQARAELAAAQQRLMATTDQVSQLQAQVKQLATQVQGRPRLLGGPRRADFTDDFPGAEQGPRGQRRSWGHEQATGAPDTFQAGDISTAWAARQPDGGEEWLHLDYPTPVQLAEVRVRETYNPGAISKVAAVLPGGQEVIIWEGVDEPGQAPTDKSFAVSGNISASSVKVYLDTGRVAGWNEIDAVELVGRDGTRQWAAGSRSSSSYGDPQ